MSIQLNPGYTVEVKNHGSTVYKQTYSTAKDFDQFMKTYTQSQPGWPLIRSVLIPIRFGNIREINENICFPTYVHFAMKINNVFLRIFASVAAMVLDIATFPIRLVTAPLRFAYLKSNPEEKHPLASLIEKNKCQGPLDTVTVHYTISKVEMGQQNFVEGHTVQNAKEHIIRGTKFVALKTLAGGIKSDRKEDEENRTYVSWDGKWTLENKVASGTRHKSFAC